jgi:hypothetical protein
MVNDFVTSEGAGVMPLLPVELLLSKEVQIDGQPTAEMALVFALL